MAMVEGTVAGLASVHGCIGAVDPVRTFGTAEQKSRFLPGLASGKKLSAFALTEPGAGSDLTALRTHAVRDGDDYVVNGEKLFITNVVPGRTVGLVCLIEKRPAVLIVDLPEQENDQFQLRKYGLWALKHTYNQGIIFRNLRVPAGNLLKPKQGDGLTIAYHGLNLGHVWLFTNASGMMRLMMASMIPWAKYRKTYGATISTRELVQRRLGRLAGLIVACDALVQWGGSLIDEGYRGEMECVIAKIFGSESQKEAAIELLMKTHGGPPSCTDTCSVTTCTNIWPPASTRVRAKCSRWHSSSPWSSSTACNFSSRWERRFKRPGSKSPTLPNPAHLWALRKAMVPYGKWLAGEKLRPAAREIARNARSVAAARRIRHLATAAPSERHFQHDEQASTGPGRSAVPDVRALATIAGPGDDPVHVVVRRQAERRSRAPSGRRFLPGPDAQTDRPTAKRSLLPRRYKAGGHDRRRGLQVDRRSRRRRDPHALRQQVTETCRYLATPGNRAPNNHNARATARLSLSRILLFRGPRFEPSAAASHADQTNLTDRTETGQ